MNSQAECQTRGHGSEKESCPENSGNNKGTETDDTDKMVANMDIQVTKQKPRIRPEVEVGRHIKMHGSAENSSTSAKHQL